MKKTLFFLTLILFLSSTKTVFAQNSFGLNLNNLQSSTNWASASPAKKNKRSSAEVRQGIGASIFAGLDEEGTSCYALSYNFAYPISEFAGGGLYIAVNPSAGISASFNSQQGGSFSVGLDIPVLAEVHFGEQDAFGGLFGLGFGYNYINTSEVSIPHKALGPLASAGVRVPIRDRVYFLRASYQLNLTKKTVGTYSTGNVLGLTVGVAF